MNAFLGWIEERIPMMRVANMHALQYPAPKNMNNCAPRCKDALSVKSIGASSRCTFPPAANATPGRKKAKKHIIFFI